jgi:hypothetical protein
VVDPNYYTHHPPSNRVAPSNFPHYHRRSEWSTVGVDASMQALVHYRHQYLGITQAGDQPPQKMSSQSKLERNQWVLDVLIDTEIDRGHSTHQEGAYEAIFAAIEAASRWRSFVVETFPGQADLPEHLVNHGLQHPPILS